MIVTNKTSYDTRALRAVFTRVHTARAKHEGRHPGWKWYEVIVAYMRGSGWRGEATIHGSRAWLWLPDPAKHTAMKTAELAALFSHELMHSYGYQHGPALRPRISSVHIAEFVWVAEELGYTSIPLKAVKPKAPKPDVQVVRYLRVVARQKSWATKLKRAETGAAKAHKEARYYERALLAKGIDPADLNPGYGVEQAPKAAARRRRKVRRGK